MAFKHFPAAGIRLLAAALAVSLAFAAGWHFGTSSQPGQVSKGSGQNQVQTTTHAQDGPAEDDSSAGETVWTCSMHPQVQLSEPGQCPICFMDLIPVTKNGDGDDAVSLRQISLSPTARKLAQVTLAPVERRDVAVETRMVGKVAVDETRMGTITAWMAGRIDKLFVDYTGSVVKRGKPMASIYSPELLTAQAELIQAEKALQNLKDSSFDLVRDTARKTREAAMEKLRLLGLSRGQIQAILSKSEPTDHVTLYAPMSGVVIEKNVVEGVYVKTGTPIYTIADLSKVWVVLGAYESDLPWIEEDGLVSFTTESLPGKVFTGKVIFIDQVLDEKTRTVDVRLRVDNPELKLKPGMLVKAVQRQDKATPDTMAKPLVIPASAPLVTGKRAVVYLAVPGREGVYTGREIVLGPRAGDHYIVKEGLSEGDLVVTQGNFKIDSALQIMAKPSMMSPMPDGSPSGGHQHHAPAGSSMDRERAPSRFELPGLMASKLDAAVRIFNDIKARTRAEQLEAARAAYSDLYDQIRSIDQASLKGQAALHWKELSIQLQNDAVLGREARDAGRLKKILAETEDHFARLKSTFALESERASSEPRFQPPEQFKDQLGSVVLAYSELMEALADDDLAQAHTGAAHIADTLQQVDMSLLEHEAHMAWMDLLRMMNNGLSAMHEAEDLVQVRTGFDLLSRALIKAIESLGVNIKGPLFVLSCPMAFENRGARWLQQDEDVRNPYFGAAMYRCGDVDKQLKTNQSHKGSRHSS